MLDICPNRNVSRISMIIFDRTTLKIQKEFSSGMEMAITIGNRNIPQIRIPESKQTQILKIKWKADP
jgi:hypothetical protein